jgi:hypothetical protein
MIRSAHQFSSGYSDASEVSPPDTAGKLGGASFLLSGAAAFSSETSMASEPPPSGSQAPVSASSPVLTGANSISVVLHHLHDVSIDAARFDFAHDRDCSERHAPSANTAITTI